LVGSALKQKTESEIPIAIGMRVKN
jgi:hypothetical protein